MSRAAALLLLLSIGLGVRMFFAFTAPHGALVSYVGRTVVVEGVVADDPDRRMSGVRTVIDVSEVNGGVERARMLAVLPRDAEVRYGDTLTVRGLLEAPQPFATDTGRTFDYPGYLEARGIRVLMPRAEVRESASGPLSVLGTLFSFKHAFERAIERVMQEPNASLMEGFLLGEKSGLPRELTAAFVTTGLVHVVVLSGYNIGIVAEWTLRLLNILLRRRAALVVAGVCIVGFALMAGGGMATARACIMGLIALMARYLNRPTAALRALAIAAAAMFAYNPLVVYDVGFILSVLATFGLITLSPWMETKLLFLPGAAVRSVAATTVAVQLFVLPALLYFTGVLSLVSVPLNVAVLPFVPLAMLLGFIAGMLALVHPYLALLPALLADLLLSAIIQITEAAAALPFAAAIVPAFPTWIVWCAYAPLVAFAILKYSRSAVQSPSS